MFIYIGLLHKKKTHYLYHSICNFKSVFSMFDHATTEHINS